MSVVSYSVEREREVRASMRAIAESYNRFRSEEGGGGGGGNLFPKKYPDFLREHFVQELLGYPSSDRTAAIVVDAFTAAIVHSAVSDDVGGVRAFVGSVQFVYDGAAAAADGDPAALSALEWNAEWFPQLKTVTVKDAVEDGERYDGIVDADAPEVERARRRFWENGPLCLLGGQTARVRHFRLRQTTGRWPFDRLAEILSLRKDNNTELNYTNPDRISACPLLRRLTIECAIPVDCQTTLFGGLFDPPATGGSASAFRGTSFWVEPFLTCPLRFKDGDPDPGRRGRSCSWTS